MVFGVFFFFGKKRKLEKGKEKKEKPSDILNIKNQI
jgi:hypothetical protein